MPEPVKPNGPFLLTAPLPAVSALTARADALGDDLVERVLRGGYPEAVSRASARRRAAWARQSESTDETTVS